MNELLEERLAPLERAKAEELETLDAEIERRQAEVDRLDGEFSAERERVMLTRETVTFDSEYYRLEDDLKYARIGLEQTERVRLARTKRDPLRELRAELAPELFEAQNILRASRESRRRAEVDVLMLRDGASERLEDLEREIAAAEGRVREMEEAIEEIDTRRSNVVAG